MSLGLLTSPSSGRRGVFGIADQGLSGHHCVFVRAFLGAAVVIRVADQGMVSVAPCVSDC